MTEDLWELWELLLACAKSEPIEIISDALDKREGKSRSPLNKLLRIYYSGPLDSHHGLWTIATSRPYLNEEYKLGDLIRSGVHSLYITIEDQDLGDEMDLMVSTLVQ
jgi:hypothetical protein